MSDTGKAVTKKYIELAKMLDVGYEAEIFNKWKKDNTGDAVNLLKKNILEKIEEGGYRSYRVNFAP